MQWVAICCREFKAGLDPPQSGLGGQVFLKPASNHLGRVGRQADPCPMPHASVHVRDWTQLNNPALEITLHATWIGLRRQIPLQVKELLDHDRNPGRVSFLRQRVVDNDTNILRKAIPSSGNARWLKYRHNQPIFPTHLYHQLPNAPQTNLTSQASPE